MSVATARPTRRRWRKARHGSLSSQRSCATTLRSSCIRVVSRTGAQHPDARERHLDHRRAEHADEIGGRSRRATGRHRLGRQAKPAGDDRHRQAAHAGGDDAAEHERSRSAAGGRSSELAPLGQIRGLSSESPTTDLQRSIARCFPFSCNCDRGLPQCGGLIGRPLRRRASQLLRFRYPTPSSVNCCASLSEIWRVRFRSSAKIDPTNSGVIR